MVATTLERLLRLGPRLDELLLLDAPARQAHLARLRAVDATLADDLVALLARQTAIEREGFLEGGALDLSGATLAGQTFGAYTLIEPLGAGGMGSVWLARRSDGQYEGQAAVKLLNLALVTRGGAGRFAREGQALARLAHPNIARLIDAGVSAGGQPYLVLEHVDGAPIDRWCSQRALGIEARVRLMQEVLAAVAHAHGKLVLHRDLKPDNILITADGRVKLLDFGIAKLLDDESLPAAPTELTQLAGRVFTPDYAAPEQVEGGDVTTATDVYALGVLLYGLLGGGHPTGRPTDTPVERVRSVVETEARRLSDALPPGAPRRALQGDLDNIVAKALKKLPAERYAGATAFADDLRRYLEHEPVAARADSLGYRTGKFIRRHRVGVAAMSVTASALVAGVIGTTWQAIEARRERDEALFQAQRASAKGNLMDIALQATGDPDRPVTHREILDRSVQLVDKQFAQDPRIAVDLLYPLAGQYAGLGDSAKDIAVMRHAAEIAAASGDPQLIGHVACNTVDAELTRGQIDAAQAALDRGLAAMAKVKQPTLLSQAECLRAEGEVARVRGDLPRAVERTTAALTLLEKKDDTTGGAYATLLGRLSHLYEERGDLGQSFAVNQRLDRLNEQLGRANALNSLVNRRNMAMTLMTWGEYREAKSIIDAIAPRVADATPDAAPPAWLEAVRGLLLARFGQTEAAQAALRASAERSRARASVRYAAVTEFNLVQVLVEQRQLDEAERLLDRLQTDLPLITRRITPATVRAQIALGRGRTAEAQRVIDAELARLGGSDAAPTAASSVALRVAARVHAAAGDLPHATALAQAAVVAAERVARNPAHSADAGEALLLLARLQRDAGDVEVSRTSARRAAERLTHGLGDSHALTREALALAASG
jgi:eukaryotic-like serine/threonine-protein kinase